MLSIVLADDKGIIAVDKRTLADIKPGEFIGTAAVSGTDGILHASEVHIFPEGMRGTGEGHRGMEAPRTSMTNATVTDTITGLKGNTFTLRYKGGEQSVTVEPDTPIVVLAAGGRSDLKPGMAIFISAATRAEDGSLRAARVFVQRTAPPPM